MRDSQDNLVDVMSTQKPKDNNMAFIVTVSCWLVALSTEQYKQK